MVALGGGGRARGLAGLAIHRQLNLWLGGQEGLGDLSPRWLPLQQTETEVDGREDAGSQESHSLPREWTLFGVLLVGLALALAFAVPLSTTTTLRPLSMSPSSRRLQFDAAGRLGAAMFELAAVAAAEEEEAAEAEAGEATAAAAALLLCEWPLPGKAEVAEA
eukprot:CAMPEP_0206469570 /NCGR_PEP_ID=MMETSP0324_2-20121206/30365_1 /ASSEMBLY_ACC=CAM_ASM_000836 /TAXON_ID=2866 /ORGANISM="Crypthecodinium cohnii, Strain Seligo" /LENGTH=162 /DNA_ID=CAMNT_0053943367 /DNA_START=260 /DNA_END=749 /DNA_ORIENTATION=+